MICRTPDEMMAHYTAALLAGDWQGCSDLYEDDAVYYRPNQVLAQDHAAIEAHYRTVAERAELLSLVRSEGQFTISGDYAFQHGLYLIESRDRSSGEPELYDLELPAEPPEASSVSPSLGDYICAQVGTEAFDFVRFADIPLADRSPYDRFTVQMRINERFLVLCSTPFIEIQSFFVASLHTTFYEARVQTVTTDAEGDFRYEPSWSFEGACGQEARSDNAREYGYNHAGGGAEERETIITLEVRQPTIYGACYYTVQQTAREGEGEGWRVVGRANVESRCSDPSSD